MSLLIAIVLLVPVGLFIIIFINYRTIMSALAAIIFFFSLIALPPMLAGPDEGLQLLVLLGIIVIIFMTVGRDIIQDRRLNIFMGIALFLAICVNFFQFCRRGY